MGVSLPQHNTHPLKFGSLLFLAFWDAVSRLLTPIQYSTAINHYTALNVTKLDILDTFPTIKVATAYIDPLTGTELESFPADLEVLGRVQPKYVELKGWEKPITGAKAFYDLPKAAREYVEFIEEFVGVKVKYIGTGPGREAMITR